MVTPSLIKHSRLIRTYCVLSLKKLTEYKFNIVTNTFAYLVLIAAWYYFWNFLINSIREIGQWNLPMLLLLMGFLYISMAVWQMIYYTIAFNEQIMNGSIDLYLVRPIHPLFGMVMGKIQFFSFIPAVLGTGLVVYVITTYFSVSILNFLIALLMCIIAAGMLGILYSIINTLSFWFGRIATLRQFFRSFQIVQQYPLDIFSMAVQGFFTFFVPLYFFGTAEVNAILSANVFDALKYLFLEISVFAFWLVVFHVVWARGLRRYESYGG